MQIDFNKNLFNKIYWHILDAFNDLSIRFIWIYGGSSSSKSYSVVQRQLISMLEGKNENALILRKYSTDIKDSIYADFKNIISLWNLNEFFTLQQNYILCNATGSFVRFRGLDDSEKVKGVSSFKRVILEEVTQFDEVDFKQIRKRLRGREGQQIIGIFNPVSEDHWIKENIFDLEKWLDLDSDICQKQLNEKGNTLILKTNYLDNVFIVGKWLNGKLIGGFVDQHTIDDFEKDKTDDFNYYQIYGLGNWGKIRTGGEFWKDFNANIHTGKAEWIKDFPIHLSWDENVNPYLTCLVWQIIDKRAVQIDEICLPDPNNRVTAVCKEFIKRYSKEEVKGLFIYGDRTSIREDTKLEKGENFFTKITQELREYYPRLRMQSVNPSVVQSGGFINAIYKDNFAGISIFVSDKCKKSIHDYQYALEDSDGTIKKSKKTNPITKVSYEEFGHISDSLRYILTVAFSNEYQLYLKGGKSAPPRMGKAVSKSGY